MRQVIVGQVTLSLILFVIFSVNVERFRLGLEQYLVIFDEQLEFRAFLQGSGTHQVIADHLVPLIDQGIVLDEAVTALHDLDPVVATLDHCFVCHHFDQRRHASRLTIQAAVVAENAE